MQVEGCLVEGGEGHSLSDEVMHADALLKDPTAKDEPRAPLIRHLTICTAYTVPHTCFSRASKSSCTLCGFSHAPCLLVCQVPLWSLPFMGTAVAAFFGGACRLIRLLVRCSDGACPLMRCARVPQRSRLRHSTLQHTPAPGCIHPGSSAGLPGCGGGAHRPGLRGRR